MADDEADIDGFVDRAIGLLGLPAAAAYRPGIRANFHNFRALYETVRGFDPPDAPDPPGVYRP